MAAIKGKVVHPISRRLTELGWTQKRLAQELGVAESTVSGYVNRKVILSRYALKTKRLIKVLGIDIDYLRRYY